MHEDDRLEEMHAYVRKTHRWVVFIGVVTILTVMLSVCGAFVSTV